MKLNPSFRHFKALQRGDSGSIVVDAQSRTFYGIVTATTPLGDIYVAPFIKILGQVKELLDTEDVVLFMPVAEQGIGLQHACVSPAPENAWATTTDLSIRTTSNLQVAGPPDPLSRRALQQSDENHGQRIEDTTRRLGSSTTTQPHNVKKAHTGVSSTHAQPLPSNSGTHNEAWAYKLGRIFGASHYSVVKECVHIETGQCYAAKILNKKLMARREHVVWLYSLWAPHTSFNPLYYLHV